MDPNKQSFSTNNQTFSSNNQSSSANQVVQNVTQPIAQAAAPVTQAIPSQVPPSSKKKIVMIIVIIGILILVGELIWAYMSVSQNNNVQTSTPNTQIASNEASASGSITLTAPKTDLKVGEKLTVTINALSNGALTDGTDVIVTYDPNILTIETVGDDKKPIVVSDIYNEYPSNSLNPNKAGVITASGIASEQSGRAVNGVFGSMIFTAKAPGKTTIGIQFNPNLTSESNMIETSSGKDILNQVQNLEVTVQ